MDVSCLFCLETIHTEVIQNPIGCPCKVQAHKQCFDAWIRQKNQMECPICHTVSIPNPILLNNVQIVYVNTPVVDQRQEAYNRQQRIAGCCCLTLIFWAVAITVLDVAFHI